MRKLSVLFSLLLIGSCEAGNDSATTQEFDYSKTDSELISTMVKMGSDVSKEHQITYLIYCSTEQQVKKILAGAIQQGFEDDYVSYSDKDKMWSTSLIKNLKLNLNEISSNRAMLTPLIPPNGCKPIRWGSIVEM